MASLISRYSVPSCQSSYLVGQSTRQQESSCRDLLVITRLVFRFFSFVLFVFCYFVLDHGMKEVCLCHRFDRALDQRSAVIAFRGLYGRVGNR